MALTTFAELKASIRDWTVRSSLGDALLLDFVALTEAVFNYGEMDESAGYLVRPLRTRDMETTATVTVTSGTGTLPTDFLEAIKVKDPGDATRDIKYAPADWIDENYPTGQDSTYPDFYTISGSSLICPISVSLTYYAKISTITGSEAGTNWLLAKAPTAYLHGGLMQYGIYDKNPEQVAQSRSMMVAALGGLNYADINSRAGHLTKRASTAAW